LNQVRFHTRWGVGFLFHFLFFSTGVSKNILDKLYWWSWVVQRGRSTFIRAMLPISLCCSISRDHHMNRDLLTLLCPIMVAHSCLYIIFHLKGFFVDSSCPSQIAELRPRWVTCFVEQHRTVTDRRCCVLFQDSALGCHRLVWQFLEIKWWPTVLNFENKSKKLYNLMVPAERSSRYLSNECQYYGVSTESSNYQYFGHSDFGDKSRHPSLKG
jgi:hypothetical protein